VKAGLCGHYMTFFLLKLGWKQSKEHFATGWRVWGGLTIFMCSSATFVWIAWYRAQLTSVAKYILHSCEVVQARLAVAKW
jgi:hypothetical protein